MSHIVEISCQVRDPSAIHAACKRLGLPTVQFAEHKLFSSRVTGWGVKLPGWSYPAVFNTDTGKVQFDNYGGAWGEQAEMNRFLSAYAVEKVKIEARKQGRSVTEQKLADGSIKLTIQVGT